MAVGQSGRWPDTVTLDKFCDDQWGYPEIARFAGHRNTETPLQYIHLSGCDLAAKVERGMAGIHAWRLAEIAEALG